MKQSLRMDLSQTLHLTPKLQQAIQLLQSSTLDLQHEIQKQLELNPMLETTLNQEGRDTQAEDFQHEENAFEDIQWRALETRSSHLKSFNQNDYFYETKHHTTVSLQEHLRFQLELMPISNRDRCIGVIIIDAINEDGFLTLSLEEIQQSMPDEEHPVRVEEIQVVLHLIQRFEPVGCGAKNLAETLEIQLDQLPESTPYLLICKRMIKNNLNLLALANPKAILDTYDLSLPELEKIFGLIHQLNPKPGIAMKQDSTEYLIPDLTVKKTGSHWHVSLNADVLSNLRLNQKYAALLLLKQSNADRQFLKQHFQNAIWFLKTIQHRQKTLLKVARYIVDYQQDFLDFGEEAMKPLTLHIAAQALNLHPSTVSRAAAQKFIHTPKGIFELKYFFSSPVDTESNSPISPISVQCLIKKIISNENPNTPLSDHALQQQLNKQGILIARRTVTKFRRQLGIEHSRARKFRRRS